MRFAICDDDKLFVSEIKNKIYDYANNHNIEPVIDCYYSGEELVKSNIKYKLIILDYQMDGISGLDAARLLRKGINRLSCIIFLTSYPEIAIPAYEVDTYRFVVKNTLYKGLYAALDSFLSIQEKDYDVSVKTAGEYVTVNTQDIVFIEAQNKEIIIHMLNGCDIVTKTALSRLYEMMPHDHFVKTHKSFIINLEYVSHRNQNSVTLKGCAICVPISRKNKNCFETAYYNYLKNQ